MKEPRRYAEGRVRTLLREIRAHPGYGSRVDLDQCPATIGTVMRRRLLLARRPLDILLLGDDDLLGLSLALTAARRRIVVVDADRVLLALIRQSSSAARVELAEYDVRFPLPHALRGVFDEVFTDPPYTLAGQLHFVHRAVSALRPVPGVGLYVCASPVYMPERQMTAVRRFVRRAGFELRARYPNFNRYRSPPDVRRDLREQGYPHTTWLSSDLFHYVRRWVCSVPPIPSECQGCIYEYKTSTRT